MTPAVYTDFSLTTNRGAGMSEVAAGASVLMRSLHAAFTLMPGRFALAFPKLDSRSPQARLSTFRVFAETVADLKELHDILKNGDGLGRLFSASFPETVPANFGGPWRAYRRHRIHSRAMPEARVNTMRALDDSGSSWIDMGSTANKQRFRLYLRAEEQASLPDSGIGQLNSYGLSVAGALLYLPIIR